MTHILITSRSFSSGTVDIDSQIEQAGFSASRAAASHELSELASGLALATGWIAGTGPITKQHLEQAPNLKVIARYGVGVDGIDLEEVNKRGIVITNTPGANSNAVAELTVALILAALRNVAFGNEQVRTQNWGTLIGQEVGSLTVGIVGFGRIGQSVAKKLSGFGSKILAFDPYAQAQAFDGNVEQVTSLDQLLEQSDVISLHAPGNDVLITADKIARLKKSVVIVNTARASLIDEQALAAALLDRRVGSYAADVLGSENSDRVNVLLQAELKPFVTLTPHMGAQTSQAIDNMGLMAWANIQAVLSGKPPINPVPLEK